MSSSAQSLLHLRQLSMVAQLRQLGERFRELEKLQTLLSASLRQDAEQGRLTPERLRFLRGRAEPYLHLYWVDSEARPVFPEDTAAAPWMLALLAPRREQAVVRPQPPGMEVGRPELVPPPGTPESYLLTGFQLDPRWVVTEMDLDYVYGPWLREQLKRFGFEDDLRGRRLEPAPIESDLSAPGQWRWVVPSFFADDSNPFEALEITLDNTRALEADRRGHWKSLALGSLFMATFALTISLAARGIWREVEFAESRRRFTAIVSHELRTPIAAIRMYTEILQHKMIDDPEKTAEYHETIHDQTGRLGRLVDNLLAVGSLEQGAQTFRLGPVDLNELASSLASGAELQLQEGLPPARADREAMAQVLTNLVDNALKYGREATVCTRNSPSEIVLEVMDRGPGIAENERKRIFEPYQRLSADRPGVGLGLALVRGFVEGQGGQVEVADRPGGGAIFRVRLRRQA